MAKIKRSTVIWIRVLTVFFLLALAVIYIWVFLIGGYDRKTASASVDGRVNYNAEREIAQAMKKWEEGCDAAPVITSDDKQKEKVIALAFCGVSDIAENDKILELLEKNGFSATFFFSGIEAAENEDFIQEVYKAGNGLGSMGLRAKAKVQEENPASLIEDFVRGRKVLSMLTDYPVKLLYCRNSPYTVNVRQAATAGGFSSVVEPGQILDRKSLEEPGKISSFVQSLKNGDLIMISMEDMEVIPKEPKVKPDMPAKDRQAGIRDEGKTEKNEPEKMISELTEELLLALKKEGIRTLAVEELPSRSETQRDFREDIGCGAVAYHSFLTDQKAVAFALWRLPDREKLEKITKLLQNAGAGATFFVTEEEAKECGEEIKNLEELGFAIGIGGIGGSQKEVEQEILFCAREASRNVKNLQMEYLPIEKFPLGEIWMETEIRQAVGATGCSLIAPEKNNPSSPFKGALYGFDLSDERSVEYLEQALETIANVGFEVWDTGRMMAAHGKTEALEEEQIEFLRKQNQGSLAEPVSYVYTTEKAMSFLFYGIKNHPVMLDVVNRLSERKSTGTFFATYEELQNSQEQIEEILKAGNELGIAYVENNSYPQDFESVMRYLHSSRTYIKWRYGVEASTVFFPYEEPEPEAMEAVSAMGMQMAGSGFYMTQSKHKSMEINDIPTVMENDFASIHLTRGSMVYFNGNFYEQDQALKKGYRGETVCGSLAEAVFEYFVDPIAWYDRETGEIAEDSRYRVKTCRELMKSEFCYQLTADRKDCEISMERNVLTDMTEESERFDYIAARYVGNSSVDKSPVLPGFTKAEISSLDKTGRFTEDPVLFLTFDDWGTDQALNPLLYVLEKYDVKATFFVRANYVSSNPNLLRSIAECGHEIASHGYSHLPLADYNEVRKCYDSLTEDESSALREDLVACYEELYRYVGGVAVDGVSSLSTNFRPPTLAVSKIGLSQVFDLGFSYSVSGDCSTNDYEAETLEEVLDQLRNGIKEWNRRIPIRNGSCIVMHMSDNSRFTAEALDQMIPFWKEQGYQFARVDRYLSEKEGEEYESCEE